MACLILPRARASIPAKVPAPLRSSSTLHYYRAKSRENYSSHSASLRDISKSGDSGQMASGLPSHSQVGRGKRVQSEASLTASVVGLQSLRSSQVRADAAPTAFCHSLGGPPRPRDWYSELVGRLLQI
uniref:Uncharacterized protein n=1 Tax=Rousettus aegyptiacus TaxID=9407 RepID=A0A7J8GB35_ROUAE|nr:hypothetical protein HJG63_011637 [Rousettus aegyptiacus]